MLINIIESRILPRGFIFFISFIMQGLPWQVCLGYTLESGSVNHMVHKSFSFYADNDGRMGPDTILESLDKFVDNTDSKSVLGVGYSVVWLKLDLVNGSENQRWNLFFPSQDYRRVEIFEVQDSRLIFLGRSGYEVPFEDRTIQTLENSFLL